jgi:hypothetical protein
MIKHLRHLRNIGIIIALFSVLICTAACYSAKTSQEGTSTVETTGSSEKATSEGFAIYVIQDHDFSKMDDLKTIVLPDKPIISQNDVISYYAVEHKIRLTDVSFEHLAQLSGSLVGYPFVVCVNRQPVYWGAFWTSLYSSIFSGVIIDITSLDDEAKCFEFTLGYPNDSYFKGDDPRNDLLILDALNKKVTPERVDYTSGYLYVIDYLATEKDIHGMSLKYLAIDTSMLTDISTADKDRLLSELAKYDLIVLDKTFDQLKSEGYIKTEDRVFENGAFIYMKNIKIHGPVMTMDAFIYFAGLQGWGLVDFDITFESGNWSITRTKYSVKS